MPVRYRILALLTLISFANYFLRNNISVALPAISEAFRFSHAEAGWILGSFNVSYALFQIPGGVFGDRVGSRRALLIISVSWGVLTLLTGFAPYLMAASTGGALTAYMVVRFFMGVTHAPVYPVISSAIGNWFPPGSWAFPNAVTQAGLAIAQAATGPLVTMLILRIGVHGSFYVLAPIGFVAGIWWWFYGRDLPSQHSKVTPQELRLIAAGRPTNAADQPVRDSWKTVISQPGVLVLSASYFCMNYVFFIFAQWLFTYLVEARGFSVLESGFLYALPFVAGAVLALVGGAVSDAACKRFGSVLGCRVPAMFGLILVSILLMAGAYAPNPYVAVALLALCFGFTQFADPLYWAAATYLGGGTNTAAATGTMNTGGNLAGFLAPIVGMVLDRFGWLPTLATGSVFAIVAALLWLFVRAESTTTVRDGQLRGQLAGADEG